MPPDLLQPLRKSGWLVDMYEHDSRCPREELLKQISDADALLVQATDRIDREVFESARKLKVIACCSLGYDNIDLKQAKLRYVIVCNSPSPDLIATTAEAAVALLLSVAKRITYLHNSQQKNELPAYSFVQPMGVPIRDQVSGIIGFGRIGSAIAHIMKRGFENSILYCNRSAKPELEQLLGARHRTLDALLAESDFVFIAVPLTKETRNLISALDLRHLKPNAIVVNVARAGILDDEALLKILAENRIFGAGLDVYDSIVTTSDCANLVMTGHMANGETRASQAILNLAVSNIVAVLSNKPPISPVTK
jgi:lactate dehydrogenase-like 2-hydroxyacid dehydrogenase